MADTDKKNQPSTRNKASEDMEKDVTLMRDVSAGTRQVREKEKDYLPRHPKEKTADYNIRLARAVLFNALDRTVGGLTGMVFRQDPVLGEDVPDPIREDTENIDNAGTHLDVFAKRVFMDAIEAGHAGILVDVPKVENGGRVPTVAEEAAAGVRPYWVQVAKENIISWRTGTVDGRTVTTQLVLHEPDAEPDGEFGEAVVHRYRVLRRTDEGVTGAVYEMVKDVAGSGKDKAVLIEEYPVTNQTEIPFVAVYGGSQTGHLQSRPPLLDLAYTNIAHYQLMADHLHALHIANVPVLAFTGLTTDDDVAVGPNAGIRLHDPNADVKYVEPSGAAFEANDKQLREFKGDMAAMGLSMLQSDTRAAETAEAKRIDKNVEDSALATAARSLQDGLENALQFHANFRRLESGGGVVVNRDFDAQPMDPDAVRVYRELVMAGQLSLETMWQQLQEGEALPDNFDPEAERERIDSTFDPNVVPLQGA